mgnify:CR=1 FL=1
MSDIESRQERPLVLKKVSKHFIQGGRPIVVLNGLNLTVERGEVTALIGASGTGKSTLMHIAGLLEKPDEGEVLINGRSFGQASDRIRTRTRRSTLGFVYQFHHLQSEFTAAENVMLPQIAAGVKKRASRGRAERILGEVGLTERLNHRPAQLSGGEQQRVAIARAIANNPELILADEPTGNLDEATARIVFEQLLSIVREQDRALLLATHDMALAARCDRVYALEGGRLREYDLAESRRKI